MLAVNHRGEPIRGPLAGRVWPATIGGQPFAGNVSAEAISGDLWKTLDREDDWAADAVLLITDVSGLLSYIGALTKERQAIWESVPVWHYCPIEGDNLPPIWTGIWNMFQPVAMSQYGARVIGDLMGTTVPMVYHGVDTEGFRPVSPGFPLRVGKQTVRTKDECKALFNISPDRKVLLRTDRNATRKFYYVLLEAFAEIAVRDPAVDLILHCVPNDAEGSDLRQEIARLPDDIAPRVKFTGAHDSWKGLTHDELVALYNAADIYISTTGGEGFGLTLAESLACGTPVVVTDWAAEREVVGDGGILIPPLQDTYGRAVRYHSGFGMDWAVPDGRAFVQPTLDLLANPRQRKALGASGRLHVQRSFSWVTAVSQFLDLFAKSKEAAA